MKKVMLICDCCKLPVPAIKSVDLCASHIKALGKFRKEREPRDKPVAKRKPWNMADYVTIHGKIMELADARPFFTGRDACKAAKVNPWTAKTAITQLIEARKIVATGKGAGRKLSKAS